MFKVCNKDTIFDIFLLFTASYVIADPGFRIFTRNPIIEPFTESKTIWKVEIDLRNFYPTFLMTDNMTDRIANIITVLLFLPFLVPSSLLYRLIDAWLDLKLKRAIIVSPSSLRILRAKKSRESHSFTRRLHCFCKMENSTSEELAILQFITDLDLDFISNKRVHLCPHCGKTLSGLTSYQRHLVS